MRSKTTGVVEGKPDINYFTCTLGEATELDPDGPNAPEAINDFLDTQCERIPNRPAVAFPVPSKTGKEWSSQAFTFRDLRQGSVHLAKHVNGGLYNTRQNVALLCQSSAEFLFNWLGLMRGGHSVLLLAPQCQPSAIAHLCRECNVSNLIFDKAYHELATESRNILPSLNISVIQSTKAILKVLQESDGQAHIGDYIVQPPVVEDDIAYLHHTSGTSSGLPKPIPQSHLAAAGVLPRLNGAGIATFSTTPLYHGGVADCFRAWTSGAMIWLFPGKDVPITASNVTKSLSVADKASKDFGTPPVRYFSSVPYVLQMVAGDDQGLARLQNMDLVGVGGAALPPAVGDDLVSKDLNLVSRFGSSECGFLMSSHRDYATDKEWQYLRSYDSHLLSFEPQDDGLAELVIRPQWPHMAKRNREDGSYATSDLFEAHRTISHAWRYHSRADSQLTLITGKKFDPAPLEDAIAASSDVADCLIFGNGRQFPGALLFRSAGSHELGEVDYLDRVWPLIQKLNEDGQSHTRILKTMLVVMPEHEKPLEKSSKGTVLRRQAEERYKAVIEMAYQSKQTEESSWVPDHDLPLAILEIIKSVVDPKDAVPVDADLFAYGVDSVACMQIRTSLQSFLPEDAAPLPLNVVYDCGSIHGISKYIKDIRHGRTTEQEDEIQLMRDLAKRYGSFPKTKDPSEIAPTANGEVLSQKSEEVIILTGATGALGAHLLDQLRSHPSNPHIICPVRASSPQAAHERVHKALTQRLKPGLPPFSPSPSTASITCLPTPLHSLPPGTTTIIHAAWTVNFTTRLRSFHTHLAFLSHLFTLALSSPRPQPPKFIFCSSTASVTSSPSPIPETISHDPTTSSPLGYSRSKWVAEQICAAAHAHTRLRDRVAVCRIGQLCGDAENGVWNRSEAWPLMLSAGRMLGALPRLEERLDWLAVDLAARAVLEVTDGVRVSGGSGEVPVYHILNPDCRRGWEHLLRWGQSLDSSLQIVAPREWLDRLETEGGKAGTHPARKLIGLWREAYGRGDEEKSDRESESKEKGKGKERVVFETVRAKGVSQTMREVQPVSEEAFGRMWHWVGENVGVEEAEEREGEKGAKN